MAPEHKGPNIEIPDELAEELAASGEPAGQGPSEGQPAGEGGEPGAGAAASLAAEKEQLAAEKAVLQDRLLRMAADHENQKRRWLREQQDLLNYAVENLIKDLLPTVDNLERALEHSRQSQPEEKKAKLHEGIELTHRSLMGVLERAGVEPVPAEGTEFNPRFHEAMRQIPSSEQAPNTVVEVYQRGYSLKGRLLRPSLVAIAAAPSPES
jgi:molecular chaperone GrpE